MFDTHIDIVGTALAPLGLHCINEIALRRARLVLGWVTVFGLVHHQTITPEYKKSMYVSVGYICRADDG